MVIDCKKIVFNPKGKDGHEWYIRIKQIGHSEYGRPLEQSILGNRFYQTPTEMHLLTSFAECEAEPINNLKALGTSGIADKLEYVLRQIDLEDIKHSAFHMSFVLGRAFYEMGYEIPDRLGYRTRFSCQKEINEDDYDMFVFFLNCSPLILMAIEGLLNGFVEHGEL